MFEIQIKSIEETFNKPRFLIQNGIRTGKTIVSLFDLKNSFEKLNTRQHLIVVPTFLLFQWKYEFMRVFGFEPIVVNFQKPKDRYQFNHKPYFGIIGYERFTKDIELFWNKIDYAIVDEIHLLSNRKSQRSKAIQKLNKRATYMRLLSATPITNQLESLWIIFYLIDSKKYNSFWRWYNTYCAYYTFKMGPHEVKKTTGWNSANLPALKQFLTDHSCCYQLEEGFNFNNYYNEQVVNLEGDKRLKAAFKQVLNEKEGFINGVYFSLFSNSWFFSLLNMLFILSTFGEYYNLENPKTKWVLDYISNNKSIIITSRSKRYLQFLKTKISDAQIIDGDVSLETKNDIVNKFQKEEINVILAQNKTIEAGLTLNKGNSIIFLDTPWNPVQIEQIKGRILDPINATNRKIKDCFFLINEGSKYDISTYEAYINKKNLFSIVNENMDWKEFEEKFL